MSPAAALTLLAALGGLHQDYLSTRQFQKAGTAHEANPFYGPHPSPQKLLVGDLGTAATLAWLAHVHPDVASPLLGAFAGMEFQTAHDNRSGRAPLRTPGREAAAAALGALIGLGLQHLQTGLSGPSIGPANVNGAPGFGATWRF